jgi:sodium transport system ATP-binding protein
MIEAQQLNKRFGSLHAVKNLSLLAQDGSITAILGANGAGKTTTLRMMCGLLQWDSGSVLVDNARLDGTPAARRRIGALLDHTGLYARLTAEENLFYFGRLHGLSRPKLAARALDVMALLDLSAIAGRRAGELSQGQKTKVAIGRTLMHSPRNLVLDEPTNGLDVTGIRSLRTALRQMRDAGMCIVFSSHALDEVQALCDHVVIVAAGVVVAAGPPKQICSQAGTTSFEDAFVNLTTPPEEASCCAKL